LFVLGRGGLFADGVFVREELVGDLLGRGASGDIVEVVYSHALAFGLLLS
jgi:hypothetical protein